MGTRHHQKVINKKGELKISQYGQWDGYPSGQGVEILDYLKQGNLDRYQKELDKINQITDEEAKVVYADSERKVNYPYLSRDCGSKIHQMIEDGEVKFVQFIDDEEANNWCEGFYTIDFQQNKFIAEFNGITREYSLDDLPTDEQFIRQMSDYLNMKNLHGVSLLNLQEDKIYNNSKNELKETNSDPDDIESLFVEMSVQQVHDKYIKPLRDNPDYKLPETGAMLFYTKKHPEGYDIDKITFTSLDEDYCVSLIESVMDSEEFAGWPFGK